MELQRALAEIGDIRLQMSRTRQFRGYTARMTLCTAGIAAAAWQSIDWARVEMEPLAFVRFWLCIAAACLALAGGEMYLRYRDAGSSLQKELTHSAIGHLLPSLLVGGLVTYALCAGSPESAWMLPGLWQIFFGLALINSRKLLPAAIFFVGAFYILCGMCNLVTGHSPDSLAAWRMGVPFGAGQVGAAFALRRRGMEAHAA